MLLQGNRGCQSLGFGVQGSHAGSEGPSLVGMIWQKHFVLVHKKHVVTGLPTFKRRKKKTSLEKDTSWEKPVPRTKRPAARRNDLHGGQRDNAVDSTCSNTSPQNFAF